MGINRLHRGLTAAIATRPNASENRRNFAVYVWFGASLAFAALYAVSGIQQAFSNPYIVQDDARQQVFWMQRFLDPALFPNDWIADYFQSITPPGTAAVYRIGVWLGFDPWVFNKLLPLVLGVLAAGYCFALCLQVLPLPSAAFMASVLLSQNLWMQDTLISATSKAFLHPLLLAFLYYLLRRSLFACLVAIALAGLFYPATALIEAGLLVVRLWNWGNEANAHRPPGNPFPETSLDRRQQFQGRPVFQRKAPAVLQFFGQFFGQVGLRLRKACGSPERHWRGRWRSLSEGLSRSRGASYPGLPFLPRCLSRQWHTWLFCGAGLTVAFLVLLPYAVGTSEFGPTVTAAAARTLPEFGPSGRARFFLPVFWEFWFNASRSGIRLATALMPPLVYAGLLLPLMLCVRRRFPVLQQLSPEIVLLPQLVVVSLGGFAIAHLLLFKLHLPSRYTQHSVRIVMVLAAAIALLALIDRLLHWAADFRQVGRRLRARQQWGGQWRRGQRQAIALTTVVLLAGTLIFYPLLFETFLWTGYSLGSAPRLYEFFAQQPKAILVASLAEEANNLPSFAQRSILLGREYAIPYHQGYYREIRQRASDLIQAQYTPDLSVVQAFIQQYNIDFWLLDRSAFNPAYVANNDWFQQYQPAAAEAVRQLEQGQTPAIATLVTDCTAFSTESLIVLDAACLNVRPHPPNNQD